MSQSVLMLNYYFPPHNVVAVFRALRFVKHLPAFGWDPLVLSCVPDTRTDPVAVDLALTARIPSDTVIERVPLRRSEDAIRSKVSALRRFCSRLENREAATSTQSARSTVAPQITWRQMVCENLFATPDDKIGWISTAVRRGLNLVKRHDVRVIYASGPPFSAHLAAATIGRLTGRPLVLDFRDPWARCPWGSRANTKLSQWRMARMEQRCVRRATCVILNNAAMTDEFRAFYDKEDREKFVSITNGIDADVLDYTSATDNVATKNPTFRILHAGALYGKRDPRPFFDSIAHLRNAGCHVQFEQVGDCDERFEAISYARKLGLAESIRVCPPISHGEVLCRMHEVDSFLLYQPGSTLQVPGKLFEMIPFRKPIVAVVEEQGAAADIVRRYVLGAIGQPGNVTSMGSAIRRVRTQYNEMRKRGRWDAALRDFDGSNLTFQLAAALNAAAAGN